MHKVIAFWHGEIKEEIFPTKMSADEFAFRLMTNDMSTCPRIVKI